MSKVRLKKKQRTISDISEEERYHLLVDYSANTQGVQAIANKYNISYKSLEHFVQDFYNKMVNTRETRQLVRTSTFTKSTAGFKPPSYVNSSFLSLLSTESDDELSEAELMYTHLLIDTLDNEIAIVNSKLDTGLKKVRGTKESNWKQQVYLRGKYLRQKPNVKAYLSHLRELRNKEISNIVSKEEIQAELVEQIESAKASGNGNLAMKAIDSLAKTIGAYTEKIQVEDLNPASAYDKMIEMAKQATVTKKSKEGIHEVPEE